VPPEQDPELPPYEDAESLIAAVYEGIITPEDLPESLYEYTFFVLASQLFRGFGLPSFLPEGSKAQKLATIAKTNLSIFSGAKTLHNVIDLSAYVFDENGKLRPFSEFKKKAKIINDAYNVEHLKTENIAAFSQSRAIEYWQYIEENADIFPLLEYVTVRDGRVRPAHAAVDRIIKPVGDPFWNVWFPPNSWRCRCIAKQLTDGIISQGPTPVNEDSNFNTNVGKTGIIFDKKHPYNDIPNQYKKASKNNFGFTIPTDVDVKDFDAKYNT
jgi:hypothetical protein